MIKAEVIENSIVTKNPPNGWRWIRLGDHVTKVGSGITPQGGHAAYVKTGIPLIRSQNVHMHQFSLIGLVFITPEQDEEMRATRVMPGDVLLNITGASIGRVCVVPPELCPANVNQHVSIIRSDGSFEPAFLSYYLSTSHFQKHIMEAQAGATRQALTKALIENFHVPLPALEEQKRIVAILNEQMTAVQRAKAATEAQLKAAKDLPSAYLHTVFDSPEAQGWPTIALGQISKLLPSKSISSGGDTQVLAITTACLTESGFQPSGIKVARMRQQDALECHVSKGEVLIARSNTANLVGRVTMFSGEPEGAVASDLTIRIWPSQAILSPFLTTYLSFLFVSGYWRERAGGASASMKKITRTQILDLQVPLPSLSDQRQVLTNFAERIENVVRVQKALEEQLSAIDDLPSILLRQAFSGKL